MTGPSSSPRGERAPRPGITWEHVLVRTEQIVDDDTPDVVPSNRAARRAVARANRKKQR